MNNNTIPAIAYGFVGITALVLTYVTLADTAPTSPIDKNESATSMLPTIESFSPSPEQILTPPLAEPVAQPLEERPSEELPKPVTMGGKQKKSKGGKKSKLHKEKNKKINRKTKCRRKN